MSLIGTFGASSVGSFAELLALLALATARVAPVFAIMPLFGGRIMPHSVRSAVSLALASLLVPHVQAGVPEIAIRPFPLVGLLVLREVVVGSLLGLLASLPLLAAEAAGRLLDTIRGVGSGSVFTPQTGGQSSMLGSFNLHLAIVVLFLTNGHLLFLRALAESYDVVPLAPVFAIPSGTRLIGVMAATTGGMMMCALGMAAPVLATLFLADLALGLMSRIAPQVPVFFVGMPAKALLGIGALLLSFWGVIAILQGECGAAIAKANGMLRP
ncbi:MAG: flagellar biosynthetic protein FliR [Pseudomonadota bacterium]